MTALSLMRLLPDNGRIVDGRGRARRPRTCWRCPRRRCARCAAARIGMIFQEPATSLNPVMHGGRPDRRGDRARTPTLRGAAARAKALELLDAVGIPEPERAHRRVSVPAVRRHEAARDDRAWRWPAEPDFLIADEPTTALDVTIQAQILDLLRELQREQGMGMLLITHDLGVVAGMAHRVAVMYAGQIVEVASARRVLRRAAASLRAGCCCAPCPTRPSAASALAVIPGTVPPLSADVRRLPLRAALRPRLRRLPRARVPQLIDARRGAQRALPAVRATARRQAQAAGDRRAALRRRRRRQPRRGTSRAAARGARPAACTSRSARACCSARRRRSRRWTACRSTSRRAARWRWWASRAAARRPPARPSCSCSRPGLIAGQALFDGQRPVRAAGRGAARRRGATMQIIFQDPYASLNPRMRVVDILEEGLLALRPEHGRAAARRARHRRAARPGRACAASAASAIRTSSPAASASASRSRARWRCEPQADRLRRADQGARRVGAGADPQPAAASCSASWACRYLFITHNIGVVEYLAHEVAVMYLGRIEERPCAAGAAAPAGGLHAHVARGGAADRDRVCPLIAGERYRWLSSLLLTANDLCQSH